MKIRNEKVVVCDDCANKFYEILLKYKAAREN
jgi:hypothetical protein